MNSIKRLVVLFLLFFAISAPGPQVGGFGFGGNPRPGTSQAQFEFANGVGMQTPCSTTAPTGSRGQVLTMARASSATCTRGGDGLRTTGIAVGDLVVLSSNVARQQSNASGVTGLLIQATRTNLILRSEQLENAAWADVGVPVVTANSVLAPDGALTADTIADDAAGAFQGRSQSVTVTATNPSIMSCYVRGDTATAARLSLDGTTADFTSLSTTSWTRIQVLDASASGVSISAQVLVGNAVGVVGQAYFWGCQVESAAGITYLTSYIPTTSATVTRATETASFVSPVSSATTISMAGTIQGPAFVSGDARGVLEVGAAVSMLNQSAGSWRWFSGSVSQVVALTSPVAPIRTYGYHDGAVRGMALGANSAGPTADVNAANKWAATIYIGGNAANRADGIITQACFDSSAGRCR